MRFGSWARRLEVGALWALGAALFATTPARAASPAAPQRVTIQLPERQDALLAEALVRIQGELAAMGLEAVVRAREGGAAATFSGPSDANVGGALVLERDTSVIRIRASGPKTAEPVVQELDARTAETTAEVVAVRSVEALRAVMLGLPKPAPAEPERPAPPPPQRKAAPAPPPPPREEAGPPMAPAEHGALSFWAAPGIYLDRGLRTASAGAEVGGFWGRSSFLAGATGSTTLFRAAFESSPGEVELRRTNALARLGYAIALGRTIECWALAGVGLSRYSIRGRAELGYVGLQSQHTSLLVALGLGATAWFSPHVGVVAHADTSLATNAPTVRVDYRELVTLERPTLWLSLGIALRATPTAE